MPAMVASVVILRLPNDLPPWNVGVSARSTLD
jgi:hypothetical protein